MHSHQYKLEWKNQQILPLMSPQDSSSAITEMGWGWVSVGQHAHTKYAVEAETVWLGNTMETVEKKKKVR